LSKLNMSGMSKATRHAAGILMSIIAVGLGLIVTYAIFSDPNVGGIIGTAADRFTVKMTLSLAVWAGVAIPLLGIWSGILESKQNKKPSIPKITVADREEEPFESGGFTGFASSEGANQLPKQEEKDLSYRGEYPKEKEGY